MRWREKREAEGSSHGDPLSTLRHPGWSPGGDDIPNPPNYGGQADGDMRSAMSSMRLRRIPFP
jgi:hypothetical protein